MIVLHGEGVCAGIAMGVISYLDRNREPVKQFYVTDIQEQLQRITEANQEAKKQLTALYEKALKEVGEANAQIFEVHRMMLDDRDYQESIANIITAQKVNAEYAVAVTADRFAEMFASMEDEYMKARAADVRDISERLIRILQGEKENTVHSVPAIVCASDLAPSETVQMDKKNVLAFVTAHGSANSHTAILARTMGIPAVIGVGDALKPEYHGKEAAVDGSTGEIYIEPDEEVRKQLSEKQAAEQERKALIAGLRGKETVTGDGKRIHLYANIGGLSDIESVLVNDAEGIGLFRSEFLYLEQKDYPSEEQQFAAYRKVLESMDGKKVVIRTLDIGADKQIDYFGLEKEENPAMGLRAIRICLTQKDLFRVQLRALYRASAYGKLAIMFPMIISVGEIKEIRQLLEDVQEELRGQGIPFDEAVEIGIMIETPAAVMISDLLAKEVDFFSIGTNDLTQYTLAIDRQNPALKQFFDPYHLAVKRMMKTVIDNAHAAGIWVGVCGELGGDLNMTEWFLEAGIDELSVSPSMVLELRKKIRDWHATQDMK